MDNPSIHTKRITNADSKETDYSNLQKPNIYNKYAPFYESVKQHGFVLFDEIRKNLSRTIQLGELEPGFSVWTKKLKEFLSLYKFHFTKTNHLKLIDFYLSILSITDLNYQHARTCFDILFHLMRKTRLLTRDDLTIDWRIFYSWAQRIYDNHDKIYGLVVLPEDIGTLLSLCVFYCAPYFSVAATREILDELRPKMCPIDSSFMNVMQEFTVFFPINLPPESHNEGFKLWLPEFFEIWESIYNRTKWEMRLIYLFSSVAWNNIGYINWEPWLSQIFTRILRNFSLPIGKTQLPSQQDPYILQSITKWIVAMIGNGSSCLQYLQDLFISIKSFYHPSNTGQFQENLIKFFLKLTENFVERVHLERKSPPMWFFTPAESYRLTEQDITDFVNCIKEYAFISIFNKDYVNEAAQACQYLSILRPELIVPTIVEKHFSSLDSMSEPHRFTSILTCLKFIARQIVQQTPSYSEGQTYVLPLLISALPGIDLNDFDKTLITLGFFDTIMMFITCVDCSSAVESRNDLTEIEKQVCLSTAKFEDFIIEFLNRIFQIIETISTDMFDNTAIHTNINVGDLIIDLKIGSIISSITQQCSSKILQKIREKVANFLFGTCLSTRVQTLVSALLQGIIYGNPIETIQYLLPKICESIEKIINNSELNILLTDPKGDIELTWYLMLFSECLAAPGDVLLIHKKMIMSIFHQCIHIINKDSYEALSNAARSLLEELLHVYTIDNRLTIENMNEPFIDFLPIRIWGQYDDIDKVQIQYHIPNMDEIDFVWEFIDTFIYPELILLNDKNLKLSNNERLRSLNFIYSVATGCFRMVPHIDSEELKDLIPTVVSNGLKYTTPYSIDFKDLKLRENLRMRLLIDIEKLLDTLVKDHSDDVSSITKALEFYSLISIYYGVNEYITLYLRADNTNCENLSKNKLCGEGKSNRYLITKKMGLQIYELEDYNNGSLSDIDKQIILKLFELSINRYSEIRSKAQEELFRILTYYEFSFQIIVDRIVELFSASSEVYHSQIKGCLYILLGNDSFFFPTNYSWKMKEKLWPLIACMTHARKLSAQTLIEDINRKICKNFITDVIIQYTNELSIKAAASLWHPLESNEIKTREEYNRADIQSYNNLMEILNSLLTKDTLQCATKGIAAICRLQKPSRIYVEKSLEEIFHNIDKSLPNINYNEYYPGDRDDNLWVTIDDYKPPKTQIEWEQTCFLDQVFHGYYTWPKMIKYSMNKRERYTQNNMSQEVTIIYNRFIDKNFVIQAIQLMILDEDESKEENRINFDNIRFKMFKGLFRNFGLAFFDNFMEQLYVLVREHVHEKQVGSHRVAAEIVAGMIRGSKYWTIEMHNELWKKLTPFLNEVCINLNSETLSYWDTCFNYATANNDPRRMYRLIYFLRTLINHKTISNTLNESISWTLIRSLTNFQWRIPSVLCDINEYAKLLLNHPSKDVRDQIVQILSISLSLDVTLLNGKPTRQPNANQFIDSVREQLHQVIETYEKISRTNMLDQTIENELKIREALNFMFTVIQILGFFTYWCQQPIKDATIRIFPYLCEMESIAANDNPLAERLTITRLFICMSYKNTHILKAFIQQLAQVCTSPKWHARRVVIDLIQNMIFCNLFNARPYAKQIHEMVLKCLFDEQYAVRIATLATLSGLYQCGYIRTIDEDLKYFCVMSKISYFTKVDGKKVILPKDIIKRHGGILGLCAIVLASPYDISIHIPNTLMILCEHLHDPDPIQESVKQCLSEFRRTHHDSWHEHREQFTEDQLTILSDVLISHNYYA